VEVVGGGLRELIGRTAGAWASVNWDALSMREHRSGSTRWGYGGARSKNLKKRPTEYGGGPERTRSLLEFVLPRKPLGVNRTSAGVASGERRTDRGKYKG